MGAEELPGWFWYAIIPVMLIELGMRVAALVDLMKRDTGPVKGMKLLWLIVVLMISLGWAFYFAIGRGMVGTAQVVEQGAAPSTDRAKAAVDSLYGEGPADAGR